MICMALGVLGLIYGVLCIILGGGIPCIFRSITGLQCPGCGVSRMCICLMRLDFPGAWQANPMLLILSPLGLYLGVISCVRYVRFGSTRLRKWENGMVYGMIGLLLVFGLWRNL